MKKVLISMALWLPYLLLSTRVNVTYRHRVPASARNTPAVEFVFHRKTVTKSGRWPVDNRV